MSNHRPFHFLAVIAASLALVGVAGCGGEQEEPPPAPGPDAPNAPALLTEPETDGEYLFSAGRSPRTFGPRPFKGRYSVRFAQYAPENPNVNFGDHIPFVAKILRVSGSGPPVRRLFREASKSGQTEVELDGRYVIEVSFGDFPFAVRFTPAA